MYDHERPENHFPFYIFEFSSQEIRNKTLSVAGFNFKLDAHVMDLALDRHKVYIAGENRNIVVLEIPLVTYPFLCQYKEYCNKRDSLVGVGYDQIDKAEKLARNKIVANKERLRHKFYVEFDETVQLSAEYFPAKRSTVGDEVDYDQVPVETVDKPSSKTKYKNVNAMASWKVVVQSSVEPVDLASATNSRRGASKFDDMEEISSGMKGIW